MSRIKTVPSSEKAAPIEEARKSVEIVLAVYESMREGKGIVLQ